MVMMLNEHHYSNTGEHVIHKKLARMTSMGGEGVYHKRYRIPMKIEKKINKMQ